MSRRVDLPRILVAVLAVAVLIAVGTGAVSSAAAYSPYNGDWDGTAELRSIPDANGDSPVVVRDTGEYRDAPANSVAVVLTPDRPYRGEDAERVREFVERGGTLVVAENFGPHGDDLLSSVGATARTHPSNSLLRDEASFYGSPALAAPNRIGDHEYLTGVNKLVFNYGSVLEPGQAVVLARSSNFSYLDHDRSGFPNGEERLGSYPVISIESVGNGEVLVVSDPGLFSNSIVKTASNERFVSRLFGDHDRVLLDVSHAERTPAPLVALDRLRESPVAQAVVAGVALGGVGLFGFRGLLPSLPVVGRRERPPPVGPDEEALVDHLQDRYPDWNEQRLRRVTREVLNQYPERGGENRDRRRDD